MKRVLACAFALSAPSAAEAGWRNTGWGMAPIETAAALVPNAPVVRSGLRLPGTLLTLGNEGVLQADKFVLRGRFYYDDDHLMLVRLTLEGEKDCAGYRASLSTQLGRPARDASSDTVDITWRDEAHSNLIRYRQYEAQLCFVDYTPLPPS